MAGNFWRSSHFQQWLLDPQELQFGRHQDLTILSEEEYQKLMIFFANFLQALGEHLKVKQQVISTAIVYFKRFYIKYPLKSIDPLLLAPTCIFLASKVEEFGVISNSRLIQTCSAVVKGKFSHAYNQDFPYRIAQVLECEFYLLELMDCCLILYHPYRPLVMYVHDMKGIHGDHSGKLDKLDKEKDELLNLAWTFVNDTYRTDIPLLFPPHLVAIACLHLACATLCRDGSGSYKQVVVAQQQWFAELNIDLDKILEISQLIFRLYDLWKNFDEKKEIAALLAKMPKPKAAPVSRPPSQGTEGTNGNPANN